MCRVSIVQPLVHEQFLCDIFFCVASAFDLVCAQHIYNVFVHSSKVYCGRNDFGQQRYGETRQSCLVTPEKIIWHLQTFLPHFCDESST